MPLARFDHAAASWKGYMYLVGGATLEGSLDAVDVYDHKKNKWTSIAPMPFSRSSCSVSFALVWLPPLIMKIGHLYALIHIVGTCFRRPTVRHWRIDWFETFQSSDIGDSLQSVKPYVDEGHWSTRAYRRNEGGGPQR